MLIYFAERETDRARASEGAGKEGEAESEAGSRLCAVSTQPDAGLEPISREITT